MTDQFITIRQYYRPNGKWEDIEILADSTYADKAIAIIGYGYRFEMETLTTNYVSMTIHDPRTGEDIGIRIAPNKSAEDNVRVFADLVNSFFKPV